MNESWISMPHMLRPDEDRFMRSYKNLRYLAAARTTVTVGSYEAEYQICQITFSKKDGSIFVSFPYLAVTAGLLSIAKFPDDQSGSVTLSFGNEARSTSHLAKFSHHPDGLVLFSQDRKIRSEVRRQSFRLDGPLGHLFQLHVYWPSGYTPYDRSKRKADRAYLRNVFQDRLPTAVTLRAEWRRKESIVANIQPRGSVSGPVSRVKSTVTGDEFAVHFLGERDGFPLQSHVLLLTVAPAKPLPSITEPALIFMGGYDLHEVSDHSVTIAQTACLLAMYPAGDHEALRTTVRNIDFNQPVS